METEEVVDVEFPYPTSITKADFRTFDTSNIDDFLFTQHRFTLLDTLSSELSGLLKELNQTLLDLVNNDYEDYIRLGKSINEGVTLISGILDDLALFKSDLVLFENKLGESHDRVEKALNERSELLYVKTLAKVNLVLNDQVTSFEDALLLEDSERKLETLIGLFLSIMHLYKFLLASKYTNVFTTKFLTDKVSLLRLEFRGWIQGQRWDGKMGMLLVNARRIVGTEE